MSLERKNILVTGGAGFIGSNLVRYFLKKYKKYFVVNLDKLTYAGNLDNLKDIEKYPNYKFIKGDINDKKLVEKILKKYKIDYICHLAAESHVDRSIIEPEIFTKTNVLGTHLLLEGARKFKIKKFLYCSTDEVYGSILKGKFKETDPLNPSNPYSASKAGGDLLTQAYFKTYHLPILITRGSNTFGPYQYPEKIIPLFITNLLENKKVPLYGKGANIRDWLYVLDHCRGIDFVLNKGEIGQIYNISGSNYLTNLSLTKKILKLMNKDQSYIKFVKDRPGHDFRYAISDKKIRRLGWRPLYKFNQALKETIDWYKNNEWWWKKLK